MPSQRLQGCSLVRLGRSFHPCGSKYSTPLAFGPLCMACLFPSFRISRPDLERHRTMAFRPAELVLRPDSSCGSFAAQDFCPLVARVGGCRITTRARRLEAGMDCLGLPGSRCGWVLHAFLSRPSGRHARPKSYGADASNQVGTFQLCCRGFRHRTFEGFGRNEICLAAVL